MTEKKINTNFKVSKEVFEKIESLRAEKNISRTGYLNKILEENFFGKHVESKLKKTVSTDKDSLEKIASDVQEVKRILKEGFGIK